jgi:hypothetical protein
MPAGVFSAAWIRGVSQKKTRHQAGLKNPLTLR